MIYYNLKNKKIYFKVFKMNLKKRKNNQYNQKIILINYKNKMI